jgi:hypothetical protein
MGYTFPGVDPKQVDAARKSQQKDKMNKKEEEEVIPDPEMSIGPVSS